MTSSTQSALAAQGADDLAALVHAQWPGRAWDAEPLDGGMTNRNWKVILAETADIAEASFAVQLLLPDAIAAQFGIDRGTQAKVMQVVGALGLGPKLIAWQHFNPSAIISEFISSSGVKTPEDRLAVTQLTADALALLHNSTQGVDLPAPISDAFAGVDWLYQKCLRQKPDSAAEFAWAMDVNRECMAARGNYKTSLVHSDLSIGNVLPHARGVSFIDWEYAGSGDRYFDCADFVEKWELNLEEEEAFFNRYRQDEDPEFLSSVVYMYRFHSRLREGLWATSVSDVRFVDFDHRAYAQDCLQRLKAIAGSERFTSSLTVVSAAKKG